MSLDLVSALTPVGSPNRSEGGLVYAIILSSSLHLRDLDLRAQEPAAIFNRNPVVSMRSIQHEMSGLAAGLRDLRDYFREPLTADQAKDMIRARVEQREELFLKTARLFFAEKSPYRPLLDLAGCEHRDLELLVRQRGLEDALKELYRAGVHVSFEQFKAGDEVWRQGRRFRFAPHQFDNPTVAYGLKMRSGGTRSRGTWSVMSLPFRALAHVPQDAIVLDTLSDSHTPIIVWELGFPSGAGIGYWLTLAKLRRPAVRWFSLTPQRNGVVGRNELMFSAAVFLARRAGMRVPLPEFTPTTQAERVLETLLGLLSRNGRCLVITKPSGAVRLAAGALAKGERLDGTAFYGGGEPLTPGKAEEIRRAGARMAGRYAASETGTIGAPCPHPLTHDDLHFRSDILAMITDTRQIGEVVVHPLVLTSLLPSAPKLLLNVELDDFATVEDRRCGCVWEGLGCRTHIRDVRSFTKLTGEGTTLLGTNCVHIIEKVLPDTFGGSSVDYQLVEAEDGDHLTRLHLLISPRIGPVDEVDVVRRFVEALGDTAGAPLGGRRPIWEQARSIRVIRRDPIPTPGGKLFPFHTIASAVSLPEPGSVTSSVGK